MKRILLLIILAVTALPPLRAQLVPAENQTNYVDSLRREFDNGPYFGLYKDNYFTVGTTVGVQKPSRTNSDVKFQISIAQKLTRSVLPWHTYIFLMYTQKTFWNVFEKSLPMHDLNFNPGLGWSKPFFNKDRYVGKLTLLLEHESNGRDSIQSRSWNRISIGGSVLIDPWNMVYGKVWIPIIDGQNNRDILNYCGIYQTGVEIATLDRKFIWDITFVKRKGWNLNFNTIFEFSWRFHKKSNQYFFLQYYNGYGEGLLAYNQFHNYLRIGFVIKPRHVSIF